ncbi:hypothetical protein [Rhizobium sp. BK602]|uniref:hypothetical protein n=1 Tax=Rhizobium sp. BK602 TaxID=2586986 RepID=UPI001614FEC6|nr:hypothetical protein [Rhizobium sp. BK602]MBB3609595.1 hypothetical protein [Rhizobium sp. BK602]
MTQRSKTGKSFAKILGGHGFAQKVLKSTIGYPRSFDDHRSPVHAVEYGHIPVLRRRSPTEGEASEGELLVSL